MSQYFDDKQLFASPKVSQYNSHMVMTNVVKPTKRKFLSIDTKFCDDYSNERLNSENHNFNLSNYSISLPDRTTDVKSIMVCNAEIPMSFYNISAAMANNHLKISSTIGGTYYSAVITVPDGQYTASSLSTQLNTLFAANAFRGVYLVHSISNNCSVLNCISGNNIVVDYAVDSTGSFDKYNVKSQLGWILGYRNINYTVYTSVSAGVQSESFINISGPNYLYLAIDEFSKGNQSSFKTSLPNYLIDKNIIAKISLNKQVYPFGTVLPANTFNGYLMTDKRSYTGKVDLHKLNVQLIDDNGNLVNLNGLDFSFCLELEYE
jgi:hypothetical protein